MTEAEPEPEPEDALIQGRPRRRGPAPPARFSEGTVMELRIFGDRIRQCRAALGLRMVDLAEDAGTTEWSVRSIERGNAENFDVYVKAAHALGLRVWILFMPAKRWDKFWLQYQSTVQPYRDEPGNGGRPRRARRESDG